jgi:hypothetical protein
MTRRAAGASSAKGADQLAHSALQQTSGSKRNEAGRAENVVSAAVLVATAFKLRDPGGLTTALKLLARAVGAWENRSGSLEAH